MSEKKKRLRPGQARVQFLVHKEEALKLLEAGHSTLEAWEIIAKKYELSISYASFNMYAVQYALKTAYTRRKRGEIEAENQQQLAQQTPTQTPTPPQAPPVQETQQSATPQPVEPKKPILLGVNENSSFQHGVISAEDKF